MMRAIYHPFEHIKANEIFSISGEPVKHLQVVRVKLDEEVVILNGKGQKAFTKIIELSKNTISFLILNLTSEVPSHQINLAVALPKKDAFEDILKIAVELGVQEIFPLTSQYSQYEYQESERVERILESALIQSNNAFLPKIHNQQKLEQFLQLQTAPLYFFNSRKVENSLNQHKNVEKIILIGPEGGFSLSEEKLILAKNGTKAIHLPTPILRAPTAVASSIGYLLAQ